MLVWPWRRFEAFYDAFQRKEAVAMLESRKMAIITGMWANDGLNEKDSRSTALEEVEEQFDQAIQIILSGQEVSTEDEHRFTKEDEANPFLAPAIKATRAIETPRDDEGTVKQAVESDGSDLTTDQG